MPLFSSLLTCLQYDTSTSIVSAALTALVMLLPHMPGSLVPNLPTLFNIYARMLFWEKERIGSMEAPSTADQNIKWEVMPFVPGVENYSIAQLPNYFTILYGLYPINFMDYIRKPQRYLRHANASDGDNVQIQPTEMRHESEKFRRKHALHPNFYTLTIESEKSDVTRWVKSEAPEVVAECMNLFLRSDQAEFDEPLSPGSNPVRFDRAGSEAPSNNTLFTSESSQTNALMRTDSLVSNTLSDEFRKDSIVSHGSLNNVSDGRDKDSGAINQSLNPRTDRSPSHSQLQDLMNSTKGMNFNLSQTLTNDSTSSESEKPSHFTVQGNQLAHLQRQILLLQNDLSFERYLKQQHMAHIGDLRRKQVTEAATEAETQNLIMMNRSLKARYEDAKKAEIQGRKESEKSRAMAKKWEADLSNKLKNLREESKKTSAELIIIQEKLDESIVEREKLKKLVCDKEVEELNWKQNMQTVELQSTEVNQLKSEVERLTVSERDNQAKEQAREKALTAAANAANQAEALRVQLAAQKKEVQRAKRLFESQIIDLQSRLSNQQEESERSTVKANVVVEEALAASRAKQAEMLKQLKLLNRKYTMLQSSFLDLQSEEPKKKPKKPSVSATSAPRDLSTVPASPTEIARGFSDPEQLDAITYNPVTSSDLARTISTDSDVPNPDEYQEPHPGQPVLIGSPPSHLLLSDEDWQVDTSK